MLVKIVRKDNSWGRILHLVCDECGDSFERSYVATHVTAKIHFCSIRCVNLAKRKGSAINIKFESTCTEKFGSINPFQVEEIKKKCVRSLCDNYGVTVTNASQIEAIKQKKIDTCIKNFGVDNPLKNQAVLDKIRNTLMTSHGVTNAFTLAHRRGTAVRSFEDPAIRRRAMDSKFSKKAFFVSKMEKKFVDRLSALFGESDIRRQVRVNGKKSIDCHIVSKQLYIQFDGIFYHGLTEKSLSYENVKRRIVSDREQDDWFNKNNLRLLRISSSEAEIIDDPQILCLIDDAASASSVTYAFGESSVPQQIDIKTI